jgi:threonine/homoserine/homoserine lactone efflux protein
MASILWVIFFLSLLTALTGAMVPGPLFTYTIIKSIQKKKYGALIGVWVILGHALLELVIITLIIYGFSSFLNQPIVFKLIGILGCALLMFFGLSLLRDLKNNKIPTEFLNKVPAESPKSTESKDEEPQDLKKKVVENPILGGIAVSMSNPYWWFWWVAIGFAFMLQYNISFANVPNFLAFYFGHEMGDLSWYTLIAILASLGKRALNKKIYYSILAGCAIFMISFGLYLGISPFLTF